MWRDFLKSHATCFFGKTILPHWHTIAWHTLAQSADLIRLSRTTCFDATDESRLASWHDSIMSYTERLGATQLRRRLGEHWFNAKRMEPELERVELGFVALLAPSSHRQSHCSTFLQATKQNCSTSRAFGRSPARAVEEARAGALPNS